MNLTPHSLTAFTPTLYVSFEAVSIVSDRRGSRPNLEAAITDLARRAAPRLFAQREEYPEAGLLDLDFASQGRAA